MTRFAKDVHAVVLAGGSGTRFWPKSRKLAPKQLCKIADPSREMILSTTGRLRGEIPEGRRTIVTHCEQVEATRNIVGAEVAHYLAEPQAKNTLAALVWAALDIRSRDPGGVMISLHADHVIADTDRFLDCLAEAVEVARQARLCLVGIKPTRPETGYGYIERGQALQGFGKTFAVERFREKPDLATAQKFLETGNFFWNSGLFVWQVSTFLEAVEEHAPQTYVALNGLYSEGGMRSASLAETYASLQKWSVDEAILERAQNIAVVSGDFGWHDVGAWDALDAVVTPDAAGNRVTGEAILIDVRNTTVDSDGPLIAAIGVEDLVIVHHKGAILVCPKDRSQDVKKIVAQLEGRRDDLV